MKLSNFLKKFSRCSWVHTRKVVWKIHQLCFSFGICSPGFGFWLERWGVFLCASFKSQLKYRPLWESGSRAFSLSSSAILRRRARRSAADEESCGRRGASRSRREGSPKLLKSSGYSESHVLNTVHTALQRRGEKRCRKKWFYRSLPDTLRDVTSNFVHHDVRNLIIFCFLASTSRRFRVLRTKRFLIVHVGTSSQ